MLDVLIRLWLAEGFLVADVMQHMFGDQATVRSLFAGLAATGVGIFVQTICPVLLATGLFTRLAAVALLLQVLVLQMPAHAQLAPYSVALLGWIVVLGPGPLSLDGMFRPGMGAAAAPCWPCQPGLGRPHQAHRTRVRVSVAVVDRGGACGHCPGWSERPDQHAPCHHGDTHGDGMAAANARHGRSGSPRGRFCRSPLCSRLACSHAPWL